MINNFLAELAVLSELYFSGWQSFHLNSIQNQEEK